MTVEGVGMRILHCDNHARGAVEKLVVVDHTDVWILAHQPQLLCPGKKTI